MLENDVAALLAREAIRDLPVRYCDCVWRDDIDGLAGLFAENGSFTAVVEGREKTINGRAALREFFAGATDFMPRPYIHNHVVELLGDGFASGRCYLDLRSARNNMDWLGAGYYEDQYVATPEGWKFQSRRFVALRMDELPAGLD
ncbi:MAG: nuclear transport factor 2 family protein [Gammaproteobacteria bacterium]